jgi:NADH-quinone oxidoreductase subunit G
MPLDCPICDEAGECKLQEYSYKYSAGYSRFDEDKTHKPKRRELGPNVVLDVERCIMCSRCIRFCDEIAKQPVLTFTERGTHVVLTTFPGTKLDNPYSMNVIELCPVGALTSRKFRFKARVWEMSSTESICVGCSRGCNVNIWVRNNEILRLTPRHNEEVNSYWMCDYGRLNAFKHVSSGKRLNGPLIRKEGTQVEVGWDEAIARVASDLRSYRRHEIAGIGSAYATNEDNYIFARFIKGVVGSKNIGLPLHIEDGIEDDFLIRADRTPNGRGAAAVGVRSETNASGVGHILKGIASGTIKALYVLEDNIALDPKVAEVIANVDLLVVHSSEFNETTALADVVLSASTNAEKDGTMMNFQGRIQRIRPAVATFEMDRASNGLSMSRWDKFAAQNDSWGKGIRKDARPTWRIITAIANAMGAKMKFSSPEEIFKEISNQIPGFKGLSYLRIGNTGAMIEPSKIVSSPAAV